MKKFSVEPNMVHKWGKYIKFYLVEKQGIKVRKRNRNLRVLQLYMLPRFILATTPSG